MKRYLTIVLILTALLALLTVQVFAADTIVAYAVEGGNIYFDTATGTITDADKTITAAVIPTEINGVPVTTIGDRTFECCYDLTNITIPDGVDSVGRWAFYSCDSLISITIPEGVTAIGDCAFYDCDALTSISIAEGVTSIGGSAFYSCNALQSVRLPSTLTTIESLMFNSCNSLTNITIPENVTSIGYGAFEDSTTLTSITIPESVTEIGKHAFYRCSALKSVSLPSTLIAIGDYAFYSCGALTSIEIPVGVTSIGEGTFSNCGALQSITIPKGLTAIRNNAFFSCDSLKSVSLPSTLTAMGDYAFSYCKALKSITIPEGVTSIGGCAFSFCELLKSVCLPSTLTSIGNGAFAYCESLALATYNGTEAQWQNVTIDSYNDALLNVLTFKIPVVGIALDETELELNINETDTLTATALPKNATNKAVKWESSDESVATVKNGVVTAIKAGTAIITATTEDGGYTAACTVNIKPNYINTNSIALQTTTGTALSEIPNDKFVAVVSVTSVTDNEDVSVLLGTYTEDGQFVGIQQKDVSGLSAGSTFQFKFTLDNTDGNIANLKAFAVTTLDNMIPLGAAKSFLSET